MKRTIVFILSALLTLAFASCNKINGLGGQIRFGVSSSYRNAPGTKTEYSGAVTSNIERIDWLTTDQLRVYCSQATAGENHWSDYQVLSFSGNDHTRASVKELQADALCWGTGSHTFYSIYPTPGSAEGSSTTLPGLQGTFSGSISASQTPTWTTENGNTVGAPDMAKAYMVARRTVSDPDADPDVELDFKPVINTFMFTLTPTMDITVAGIEIVSTSCPLSGDFTVSVTGETELNQETSNVVSVTAKPTFAAGTNDVVSVSLPTGGVALATGKSLTFTVFTVPQAVKDLSLRVTLSNGLTNTLALNDNTGATVTFPVFHKANITTGYEKWNLVLFEVTTGGQVVNVVTGEQTGDWSDKQ